MSKRWAVPAAAVLAGVLPFSADAQDPPEYLCTQGDLQRRVVIFYETGAAVPCEVHYFKDTEAPGQREVLWRASNQSGYCESRTESFVEKLEGWGWSCSAGLTPEPAASPAGEPAPADDTENLAPAVPETGE